MFLRDDYHKVPSWSVTEFTEDFQGAHDRILRCRINAAFRSQVERRIYAAERAPEEICPAPTSKFLVWGCFVRNIKDAL